MRPIAKPFGTGAEWVLIDMESGRAERIAELDAIKNKYHYAIGWIIGSTQQGHQGR